ncbi:MAG: SCO1664 family protein [Actinomycetota bacterium]
MSEEDALILLEHGDLTVTGLMTSASNTTLRAVVTYADHQATCVYKPLLGERPLRDYPQHTLSRREVAAYVISQATGWDVVPPTVWRDGPYGPGSAQLWIDSDDSTAGDPTASLVDLFSEADVPVGWLPVLRAEDHRGGQVVLAHADDPRLTRLAVFDAIVDNADRKGGHLLVSEHGHVWGIDHGLTFNIEDKLRTILWGWAGLPLPDECLDVLNALDDELQPHGSLWTVLTEYISSDEIQRTSQRIKHLLQAKTFPLPDLSGPVIPWPAW